MAEQYSSNAALHHTRVIVTQEGIHRTTSVGTTKLASAEKTIREINPDVNIIVHDEKMTSDNIIASIADYNFILDCTDRFESKFLINDACVISKKPYSHAGVVRFGGQVMTYVPDMGPCLRCILDEVPSDEDSPTCATVGVLGSVTGIIGSLQATEAIKYVTGIGKLLTGRILSIDALNLDFHTINIPIPRTQYTSCQSDTPASSTTPPTTYSGHPS